MKAIFTRIRSSSTKVIAAITQNRTTMKIGSVSKTALALVTRGRYTKAITMIILGIIATASFTMIVIFGVWISHLASSASEETDSPDITYKVEVADMTSEAVARLVPLMQAFAGDSFVVKGTTDLDPETTAVTILETDIDLNADTDSQDRVEASGWTFTQYYTTPDSITSEAIMSDNSDNNIIFAATTPLEYEDPSDPSLYIIEFVAEYSSIFRLLGFEVSIVIPITYNPLETITAITAIQEGTVIEMRVWIDDPSNPNQVNIALLKSTPEVKSIAEEDFATFVDFLTEHR